MQFKRGAMYFLPNSEPVPVASPNDFLRDDEIPRFDIPASSRVTIYSHAQRPFRGQRLVIDASRQGVSINSFVIGVDQQFVDDTAMPVELFGRDVRKNLLAFSVAHVGQLLRIELSNETSLPVTVRCWLEGEMAFQ